MRGNIALPPFWSQALDALHELTHAYSDIPIAIEGRGTERYIPTDNRYIWDNRHYIPPKLPPRMRDRCGIPSSHRRAQLLLRPWRGSCHLPLLIAGR
eukprot:scaffold6282_cov119-Isochrysis_galbana.AAC.1